MSEDIRAAVDRARRGDKTAFGLVVRHYQRRVYFTAYRILGSHEDADDAAQEAFVRAFRGLASFDQRAEFYTWLYRIVVNVSLNHLRRRKRRDQGRTQELEDVALPPGVRAQAGGDPGRELELKRMVQDVAEALEGLSDTLRVTLVAVVFDGLSYSDAAQVLDTSEGTIAWRVHEARQQLRKRLDKYLDITGKREPGSQDKKASSGARGAADVG